MLSHYTLQFFMVAKMMHFLHITAVFVNMAFNKEDHILINYFIRLKDTLLGISVIISK